MFNYYEFSKRKKKIREKTILGLLAITKNKKRK